MKRKKHKKRFEKPSLKTTLSLLGFCLMAGYTLYIHLELRAFKAETIHVVNSIGQAVMALVASAGTHL